MSSRTLSTVINFQFVSSTFNVNVEPQIGQQSKYRPTIDKDITTTCIAMINALFHTSNIPLQQQFKKYKLISKAMLLIFFVIIFTFIVIFIVLENNRAHSEEKYTEFRIENDLIYESTYIILGTLWILSLFFYLTYRRLYHKLRTQWRNECVRNLYQSAAIWSMQFPILQFEIKYPGYMYKDYFNRSIKKARKAFKDTTKKQKKKSKNILKSPRMNSPRAGFSNFNSPAKYDKLSEENEESLNTCKLALCCCCINDEWGFIRIFYKYDSMTNNDSMQYALNQLTKNFCLFDEDDPQKHNNVQIVQMVNVKPNEIMNGNNLQLMPPNVGGVNPNDINIIEIDESEPIDQSEFNEGSEVPN